MGSSLAVYKPAEAGSSQNGRHVIMAHLRSDYGSISRQWSSSVPVSVLSTVTCSTSLA
jgi:hypothetical protein